MRLRGYPPDGTPALSYVGSPTGSIIGSAVMPVGKIISFPGTPGAPGAPGDTGPAGRGISSVSIDGNDLVQTMTDSTQERVTVPALTAASSAAADAASSASAAAGSATAASTSASNAADSAADAAQSAQEAADVVASGIPNATTSVKGGVIISGDVGGTYDNLTVPGLADKADLVHTHDISAVVGLQTALDAKENSANKGVAGGYAPLDGSALVPSSYLPSYVDDVLEYANLGSFPATGTTGKIYVALDTNKVYRWGGSSYVEISPSPGSTDAVPEGSVNQYYTDSRVQSKVTSMFGTGAGTITQGNDSRLSDARTPTAHSHAISDVTNLQTTLNGKVGTDGTVLTAVKVTQAQYDALGAGRPSTTFYVIVG